MAQLPRYTKTGIQAIAPVQVRRPAGQRGAIISNEINKMQQFVTQKLTERRTLEAQQAVAEFGDLSILQQISERGGPSSVAERAAYDLANQVGADRVESQARIEIDRIIDDASRNSTPYELVNSQILDAVDGFSSSLSVFNPAIAAQLKNRLESYGSLQDNRYLNAYNNVQQAASITEYSQLEGQRLTHIRSILAATNGEWNEDAVTVWESMFQSIDGLNVSDADKQIYRTNLNNQGIQLQVEAQIMALPTYAERQEAILDLRQQAIGTLDPEQTESFIRSLNTVNQQIYSSESRALENAYNREITWLQQTGTAMPGAPDISQYADILTDAQFETISAARLNANVFGNLNNYTETELQGLRNNLATRITPLTDPSQIEEAGLLTERLTQLDASINRIIQLRNTDPAQYAQQNTNVNNAYNNFFSLQQSGADPTELEAAFTSYITSLDGYYNSIELDETVRQSLPNTFVQNIARQLDLAETDQKLALINGITAYMNEEEKFGFINQLSDQNINYDLITGLQLPDSMTNRSINENLLFTIANLNDDTLFANLTKSDITDRVAEATEDEFRAFLTIPDQAYINYYHNRAETTARVAGYLINTQGMNMDQAVADAKRIVFNDVIAENTRIPLDLGLDSGQVSVAYDRIRDIDYLRTLNIQPMIGDNEVMEEVMLQSLTQAKFINNETGDGVYMVLPHQDYTNQYVQVMNRNGQFIEFSFDFLKDIIGMTPSLSEEQQYERFSTRD